ncbi:hypothetical protein BDQ17DRAFT_293202 [Cyathus striatus]|nr:hypothetical protein BDQ17DRAFT_293202 [Cyathus striatus]
MTDQVAVKKILSELSKREDLKNKYCNDCGNPNPQWASLGFSVFVCLQCAGTHRGFGVHISFVRSISMDTWSEDQIKRMQLGGNGPFRDFIRAYEPADLGGYKEGLTSYDTYHCWAATQYKEKLDAMLASKDWSPSSPPPTFNTSSRSVSPAPSAAQGLRKSRASARALGSTRSDSHSPSSFRNSNSSTPNQPLDQKSQNENYFSGLGQLNENRPTDLPPSQGGRYQGFGNTPNPPANQHPSFGLSSAAAPTLNDLQQNPMGAISKGWSLFSAAVAGATKVVAENVIQPGVEKVTDPNFQASVKGYVSEAQKKAAIVGSSANQWSKNQFGLDVAESVGGVVGSVRDRVGGNSSRQGYSSLSLSSPNDFDEGSALYNSDGGQERWDDWSQSPPASSSMQWNSNKTTSSAPAPAPTKKNNEWDDEWKDF